MRPSSAVIRRVAFALVLITAVSLVEAAAGPSVEGRVVSARGVPLAEAEVTLSRLEEPHARAMAVLSGSFEPAPVARVKSGADGRYRLVAPSAGVWRIRVKAPGFAPQVTTIDPLVDDTTLLEVALQAESVLEVSVIDTEGAPVPGALVRMGARPSRSVLWETSEEIQLTDASGVARFSTARGTSVELAATHQGALASTSARGTRTTLRLARTASRALALRDDEGAALANAVVAHRDLLLPLARSDERGRIDVPLAETGAAQVILLADHGGTTTMRLAPRAPEEPEILTVTIPRPTRFAGRVIDAETRKPIAGAIVRPLRSVWSWTTSDTAGRFEVRNAGPNPRRAVAAATGYLSERVETRPGAAPRLVEATIAMRAAATVAGRVVDEEGRPVARAEVKATMRELRSEEAPGPRRFARSFTSAASNVSAVTTGDDGRFIVRGLDPERRWQLDAVARGRGAGSLALAPLRAHETRGDLMISVHPTQAIRGRALDQDGTPLAEAEIDVEPVTLGPRRGMGRFRMQQPDDRRPVAFSAADGSFVASDLASGTYEVIVRRLGYARTTVPGVVVGDSPQKTVDIGDVVLEPGVAVFGKVLDPSGAPIAGAEVRLGGQGAGFRRLAMVPATSAADAVTGADGAFVISDLRRDDMVAVSVTHESYLDGLAEGVRAGSPDPVSITLEPACRVEGIVVDGAGEPVAGAQVVVAEMRVVRGSRVVPINASSIVASADDGTFVITDAEPGALQVVAVKEGFLEPEPVDVVLVPAEPQSGVRVVLARGARVAGTVRAEDGTPLPGADIEIAGDRSWSRFFSGSATTDGDGRYLLDGVPPGKTSIEVTHRSHPRTVRDAELGEGETTLDITMERGAIVTGRVVGPGGEPVLEARVTMEQAGAGFGASSAITDANGGFILDDLTPGDHTVRVTARGYAPPDPAPKVAVAASGTPPVEIVLRASGSIVGRVIGLDADELAAASISASGGGARRFASGIVDRDGSYRIEDIGPGTWNVVGRLSTGRIAEARATVPEDGTPVSVDLEFGSGFTISGVVLDGDEPVAGANVFANSETRPAVFTRTDDAGAFVLEGLDAGTYSVSASDWDRGASTEATIRLEGDERIELRFASGSVSGKVIRGSDRTPLSGVAISSTRADGESSATGSGWRTSGAASRGDGSFVIERLHAGTWRLVATREGYAAREIDIALGEGEERRDVVLELEPTEGLSLQLTGLSGSPPAGTRVAVLDAAGRPVVIGMYAAAENGVLFVDSVPPGTWSTIVHAGGYASTEVTATAPGPATPVVLGRAASLVVEVPELQEGPAVEAWLTLRDGSGRVYRALRWISEVRSSFPLFRGAATVEGLAEGSWSASVTAADGRTWQGTIAVTAAAPARLVLGS